MAKPRRRLFFLTAVLFAVMASGCSGRVYYDTPPMTPVPVEPSNAAELSNGAPVSFIWRESDQVELYEFHIFDRTTSDIQRFYRRNIRPTDVCEGGLCSINLTVSMPVDDGHAWRVRAFNSAGYSPWSRTVFKIAP